MRYEDEYTGYVPASERRKRALQQARDVARAEGRELHGVIASCRSIARSFWGRAWNRHIEAFQDYESRLPLGRSCLRNGSVADLEITPGRIDSIVIDGEVYHVHIQIEPLEEERWAALRRCCAGKISSLADLVEGKLSDEIIALLCGPEEGIFPRPGEIRFDCDCPDWSDLCRHLAAALYAVSVRLDEAPELLFTLRGVEPQELFSAAPELDELPELDEETLSDTFGIDIG